MACKAIGLTCFVEGKPIALIRSASIIGPRVFANSVNPGAKVADVVSWLPFRHEDRTRDENASFQVSDIPVCHRVLVTKTGNKFFGRRGSGMFEASVEPSGGAGMGQLLTLRWWGMHEMAMVIFGSNFT